jgi:hypothetical protein
MSKAIKLLEESLKLKLEDIDFHNLRRESIQQRYECKINDINKHIEDRISEKNEIEAELNQLKRLQEKKML